MYPVVSVAFIMPVGAVSPEAAGRYQKSVQTENSPTFVHRLRVIILLTHILRRLSHVTQASDPLRHEIASKEADLWY